MAVDPGPEGCIVYASLRRLRYNEAGTPEGPVALPRRLARSLDGTYRRSRRAFDTSTKAHQTTPEGTPRFKNARVSEVR